MMSLRRWAYALAGAALAALLILAAVWQLDQLRTSSKIDSCLDRGGAWDYDARLCQLT